MSEITLLDVLGIVLGAVAGLLAGAWFRDLLTDWRYDRRERRGAEELRRQQRGRGML